MKKLKEVKKELERIYKKGFVFNNGKCSSFEYVELLIDCDAKEAILAIHNDEEMNTESLIGLIDFDYMINNENNKLAIKANRFYNDDELHAWLNFEEVSFKNNVIRIKCELYISY